MRKLYTECDLDRLSRPVPATCGTSTSCCIHPTTRPAITSHDSVPTDSGRRSTTSGLPSASAAASTPITSMLNNGPAASGLPPPSCRRRSTTTTTIVGGRFQTDYGTWSSVLVEDHLTADGSRKAASSWRRLGFRRLRGWLRWPPEDTISVAEAIDQYSRLAFPVAFVVLSTVYWTVYLQIRPTLQHDPDFVEVE